MFNDFLEKHSERIGIIFIIVSLLFVGYEISENSRSSKASNHLALIDTAIRLNVEIMKDDQLAKVFQDTMDGVRYPIGKLDNMKQELLLQQLYNIWEVAFYNFHKGQLEDDVWLAFRGYFSEYLLPKSYDFWEKHRFMYGPAFREHVDSIPAKM